MRERSGWKTLKAFLHTQLSRRYLISAFGVLGLFALWQLASGLRLFDRAMFPSPGDVLDSSLALAQSGELFADARASLMRIMFGFLLGSFVGVTLGVALGRNAFLESLLGPILQMGRAIPPLALVPLIVFWFGISEGAKIFLIAWAAFFPVWINTLLAVKGINPLFVRAGESLGARRGMLLLRVVVPASLSAIFAGMRVSLSLSFTVLVAAELAGAMAGLGYLIQTSALSFRVDNIFAGIVVLAMLGFIADSGFMLFLYRCFPWYRSEQGRR
jgi:ABC-type nitrate/sulfonate/bicarbonate transport system permease component